MSASISAFQLSLLALLVFAVGCDETPAAGDGESDGTAGDEATSEGSRGVTADDDGVDDANTGTSGDGHDDGIDDGVDDDAGNESDDGPAPECDDSDPDVACYDGPAETADVGLCQSGVRSCVGGIWSECIAQTLPGRETCNGEDDDCDGTADEDCECLPDETDPCYGGPDGTAGVGLCVEGQRACDAGSWSACVDEVLPTEEACNGEDDDCDGQIDETCACSPGDVQSCYSGPAGTEGVGSCSAGQQTCDGSGQWGDCDGEVAPGLEVCNLQDDDCDGEADELTEPDACDTGDDGICADGVEVCQGGGLGCEPVSEPQVETCDGLDNDCDGQTDEGLTDDPILIAGELPDAWSGTIPLVGSYPSVSGGLVPGRLNPADDVDWFSAFAEEQVFDILGDTPVDGLVTVTSPGPGFEYEVCACWSTSAALCAKNEGGAVQSCVTSTDGDPASVTVQMAMIQGTTDTGYLDVSVRAVTGSATGCGLYDVQWQVSEG